MEIRVDRLRRYFGATRAVDDISFSFRSGQIYGFIGPNGAGKTTTMRILATLDEATGGDAFLDDLSILEEPERARRLVGFMPDYLPAHRDVTVHEYLDFYARAYDLVRPERPKAVAGVEAFAGLEKVLEKTVQSLSKGMKQRVNLARAVIHDPPVLVLDEPAGGLDPRARIELRELLKALAAQGKALLVSSHILTELSEVCDGAVIIEQGKIVRAGTIAEILAGVPAQRKVIIRADGHVEALHRAVLELSNVQSAAVAGQHVEVLVDGDEAACQALLQGLVQRGLPVSEFRHHQTGLEELFMSLTRGEVQ